MSLTRSAESFAELIQNARAFIDDEVIPREDLKAAHDRAALMRIAADLRERATARGLLSPRRAVANARVAATS